MIYQERRGPLFPPQSDQQVRFDETWTSGRCLDTLITRLGGARNCLHVTVTVDELWIRPQPPFHLMFLPEIYGLQYRVPTSRVARLEKTRGLLGTLVKLEFTDDPGRGHVVKLRLRRPDDFLAAMTRGLSVAPQ